MRSALLKRLQALETAADIHTVPKAELPDWLTEDRLRNLESQDSLDAASLQAMASLRALRESLRGVRLIDSSADPNDLP
jgi:hypothetical protein